MRNALVLAVFGAAAMLSAPAVAQDEEDGSEQTSSEVDPDAMHCERRAITGTRARRQTVCMTNAEWEVLRRDGNRDAQMTQDAGTQIGIRGE